MSTSNINSDKASMAQPQLETLVPADRLKAIRAVILLGGSVRQTNLAKGLNRSMLNLPIDNEYSVMDQWGQCFQKLTSLMGRASLDVRIIANKHAIKPTVPEMPDVIHLTVEEDPAEFRGTGGILRDISRDYDSDDYLLVANGAQLILHPFVQMVNELASLNADVSLVSHGDGIPSGFFLIRVGALDVVPTAGFHDLKEQCLPLIAKSHCVKVKYYEQATGLSMRTLDDYIGALRWYHRQLTGHDGHDPFGEDWRSSFSIIEEGAQVSKSTQLVDSVVLCGAKVSGNTVVVRSIIGMNATVPTGRQIVDQLVRGRRVSLGGGA